MVVILKLADLLNWFEELWPSETADDWDRPGLAIGNKDQDISRVLFSVDVTEAVVQEAIDRDAQLIVSHHPLLLRGVNEVTEHSLKGKIVTLAIQNRIAVFSAHTNADKAELGTATALAKLFGIENLKVLDPITGHGLIGELKDQSTLLQFAQRIAKLLPPVASGIRVAGDPNQPIRTVSLSPGAGDSDLGVALEAGVDVFITSDLRHHPAQDFVEVPGSPRALIDISHWGSESVYLAEVVARMNEKFADLEAFESEVRTDPWDFVVLQ